MKISSRPAQIIQALLNLLHNSCDAIEVLDARWIELKVEKNGNYLNVRVIDLGAGISEELERKIMEPFFTTKVVGRGTGLGLSISMGIAEAHSGRLYYDRKYSNTCFVLELPLADSQ